MKTKKSELTIETLIKIMIVFVALIALTLIIFLFKDKIMSMLEELKYAMRFH